MEQQGLVAILYGFDLGAECALDGVLCQVVDKESLRPRCDAVATVCMHVLAGPEPRWPGRSAMCEPHSL